MTRPKLPAIAFAAALGAASLAGCAALDPRTDDTLGDTGELAAELEQRLSIEPDLVNSQLTVQEEADGTIVINGFAESLEAMRAIDEVIEDYDSASIENNVVVRPSS